MNIEKRQQKNEINEKTRAGLLGRLKVRLFIIEDSFKKLEDEKVEDRLKLLNLIRDTINDTKQIKQKLGLIETNDGQISKWEKKLEQYKKLND